MKSGSLDALFGSVRSPRTFNAGDTATVRYPARASDHAFLVALGAGLVGRNDIDAWNPVTGTVEPEPANAGAYARLYRLYLELYPATREIAHTLANWGANPCGR